jgi:hypothetical protein
VFHVAHLKLELGQSACRRLGTSQSKELVGQVDTEDRAS